MTSCTAFPLALAQYAYRTKKRAVQAPGRFPNPVMVPTSSMQGQGVNIAKCLSANLITYCLQAHSLDCIDDLLPPGRKYTRRPHQPRLHACLKISRCCSEAAAEATLDSLAPTATQQHLVALTMECRTKDALLPPYLMPGPCRNAGSACPYDAWTAGVRRPEAGRLLLKPGALCMGSRVSHRPCSKMLDPPDHVTAIVMWMGVCVDGCMGPRGWQVWACAWVCIRVSVHVEGRSQTSSSWLHNPLIRCAQHGLHGEPGAVQQRA